MSRFETVIGLEVHAQLLTESKIFCSCSTAFGAEPNQNVCPVCAGMPGVLPVLNAKSVEYAVKMGLAVGCDINRHSILARKNYFYPDLPKGYQISQYEEPLCEHGQVLIEAGGAQKTIGITRIHMEEDAGKNVHSSGENKSFVDLNRCGVPLIEIVSDPDIRSSEEAVAYLKSLRSVLLYLGICDAQLEEGSFRCDANVSVRPVGEKEFGTRTELKNLNSFRNVQKAIDLEVARHIDLIEDGEPVVQETRLYDAHKNRTASMRGKEEAHDYRYYPDPDLVPLVLEEAWIDRWRGELPELPAARRQRFQTRYGLPAYDAALLTSERAVADYFEAAVAAYDEPKKISNWMMTDFLREVNARQMDPAGVELPPEHLARLVAMVDEGAVSGKVGKQVFADIFETGRDPEAYCREKGLVQISDASALEGVVAEVVAANPDEAARYAAGEKKLSGFFIGQVMKETKGQANPKLVAQLLDRMTRA